MPRVSVIVPNYNHARFLRRRLDSVLNQSFEDYELLLLDDASSDSSLQVFEEYLTHPKVKVLCNKYNSGSTFKQWNKGVKYATGEYIWIAESDDFAEPQLLATLVARLDANPECGLAYCQSWIVDENDTKIRSNSKWTEDLDAQHWQEDYVNEGKDELAHYAIRRNTIPNASAVVFRKGLYEAVGGADESLKFTGDWKLWAALMANSSVAFVATPLNFYRKHSASVTSNSNRGGLEVEEKYRVLDFISKQVKVPAPILDGVLDHLSKRWAEIAFQGGIPIGRHRRLLHLVSQQDPKFPRRFILQFVRVGRKHFATRARLFPVRIVRGTLRLVRLMGR